MKSNLLHSLETFFMREITLQSDIDKLVEITPELLNLYENIIEQTFKSMPPFSNT